MKKYTHITIFIGCLLISSFTFGQDVILAWDVQGRNQTSISTQDGRDGVNDSGLETSIVTRGEGLRLPNQDRLFSIFAASGFGEEREDAFREGDYFELEIVPTEGNQVNLTSLIAKFRRTTPGPREFLWQYKLSNDCSFADVGVSFRFEVDSDNGENRQAPIDLSGISRLQNVAFPDSITLRLYGWDADGGSLEESFGFGRDPRGVNDLIIEGEVSSFTGTRPTEPLEPTIWNGRTRTWSNGVPSPDSQPIRPVIIGGGTYDTSLGDIVACSLIVREGAILSVSSQTYVEVFNDVTIRGRLFVDTQGNFVQNNDSGTFNLSNTGSANLQKESSIKTEWFHYTYWSSPVNNITINEAFEEVDANRRFRFNGQNYIDADGNFADDNADAWVIAPASETLRPAVGYAVTSPNSGDFPRSDVIDFLGEFNTGVITTDVFFNSESVTGTWNLIGNPYPGAFDFDVFHAENSGLVDGVAYVWSQFSPLAAKQDDNNNDGNFGLNFNRDDYAIYNVGVGGVVGAGNIRPTKFIPSGQSFFIQGLANGQVTFNNSMRVIDPDSNTQFFKRSLKNKRRELENRVWIDLTSENITFNQILIGYVKGATNQKDGLSFDVPRVSSGGNAIVYSRIKDSNTRYAIQGRHIDSIQHQDVVDLGFSTFIGDNTKVFSLSIDKATGDFLEANPVYIKDNLLGVTHNLSSGSYDFTSEAGEFNDRFQIEFKENVLSVNENAIVNSDYLTVRYLKNSLIRIDTNSNLTIANIGLYDILGKQLVSFKEDGTTSEVSLLNYKNGIYIIKIKLTDGSIVSKKIIK